MLSLAGRRMVGIGAIAVAALAIGLGIAQPNPFAERYRYWAVFDTAHGLGATDRDVRIAGANIGEVGTVERVGDDVRAELVLHEDLAVHADARAKMRPRTLFEGSNFVELEPGSPSAPRLAEGDEIPLEQTATYVTVDEAVRVLRPQVRRSFRDLVGSGARTLRGEAVTGTQRTLRGAPGLLRPLAPAARAAQGPEGRELAGAIVGISRTVDELAESEEELVPLARRVNRTAAGLAVDDGAPLDAALGALPPALAELHRTAPELQAVIERLEGLSGELRPALPELAAGLRAITPALEGASPVLRDATPLIRDARTLARRLAEARPGLVRMFNLLDAPLALAPELFEVFNAPSEHGAPAYRQLVAGAFSGADATFRSYRTEAQAPDAPGHVLRIGLYVNPEALPGLADLFGAGGQAGAAEPAHPACAEVARISEPAATQLRALGGCR